MEHGYEIYRELAGGIIEHIGYRKTPRQAKYAAVTNMAKARVYAYKKYEFIEECVPIPESTKKILMKAFDEVKVDKTWS